MVSSFFHLKIPHFSGRRVHAFVMTDSAEDLGTLFAEDLLHHFPAVQHAFAYGSAVFHQPGLYDTTTPNALKPMLDFILAVEDPTAWHVENIRRNRDHYSFVSSLGASAVVATAERVGAGVYFNTLIPWHEVMIKYGVVGLDALQRDLLTWDRMYLAGRMHKPVLPLCSHPAVDEAQAENLQSALRMALLLLPPKFELQDLLHAVCMLSYAGDFRMGLAEDDKKIERIVNGSTERLQRMYQTPLRLAEEAWGVLQAQQAPSSAGGTGGSSWIQDCSPTAQAALLSSLPAAVLHKMAAALGRPVGSMRHGDRSALADAVAGLPQRQLLLRKAMASIVRASSHRQALAGLLSAGVLKSAQYAVRKLRKAWA